MKESIIQMLKEMVEYANANQNGNLGGFDIEYVEFQIEVFEESID